jgi:hypothetical protein
MNTTTNYDGAGNEIIAVNGQAYSYDSNWNLTINGIKTLIYNVDDSLSSYHGNNEIQHRVGPIRG